MEAFEIRVSKDLTQEDIDVLRPADINPLHIAYNQAVSLAFELDFRSSFGQAITDYFATTKLLKALLDLALYDKARQVASDLTVLWDLFGTPPSSREEMVAYFRRNPDRTGLGWFTIIEQRLNMHKKCLPKILNDSGPSDYMLIECVLADAIHFVTEYSPTVNVENTQPKAQASNKAPVASVPPKKIERLNPELAQIELRSRLHTNIDPMDDLQAQISELSLDIVSRLQNFDGSLGSLEGRQETLALLKRHAVAKNIQPIKYMLSKMSEQTQIWDEASLNKLRTYAQQSLREGSLPVVSGNPLLWSYSTLALLFIYRQHYSSLQNKSDYHITTTELKQVQKALLEGQNIKKMFQQLIDPKSVLNKLESSLHQFKASYQENFETFKLKQLNEAKEAHQQANKAQRVRDRSALKAQIIYPYLIVYDGQQVVSAAPGYICNGSQRRAYTFVVTDYDSTEKQKTTYLTHCDFVLYPESGFEGPILPLTQELMISLQKVLPKVILDALELNLGELTFRYLITDKKIFHWTVYFGANACWKISLDYKPFIHTGDEAIWWYWVRDEQYTISNTDSSFLDYVGTNAPASALASFASDVSLLSNNALSAEKCGIVNRATEKLIAEKNKELRILYNIEVGKEFESDTDSPFAKAITKYFMGLQTIKALLALCWEDKEKKRESLFNRVFKAKGLPTSREEMVIFLANNLPESSTGLELFDKMDAAFIDFKQNLPQILEQTRVSYLSFVEEVISQCACFIDDYSPTAKVVL